MVHYDITYLGGLRCEAVHAPSGMKILTDAPVDNHGKGEAFSPTDLASVSLGLCMLTVMGIAAERHGVDLRGTTVSVDKTMSSDTPRRIARIDVVFRIPLAAGHPNRALLEATARACPVHHSLHPDVDQAVHFEWTGVPSAS